MDGAVLRIREILILASNLKDEVEVIHALRSVDDADVFFFRHCSLPLFVLIESVGVRTAAPR